MNCILGKKKKILLEIEKNKQLEYISPDLSFYHQEFLHNVQLVTSYQRYGEAKDCSQVLTHSRKGGFPVASSPCLVSQSIIYKILTHGSDRI